jgi:predicted nucleic acid-binding protein
MKVLLDTNILLRAAEPSHPLHAIGVEAVEELKRRQMTLCVVPQVLFEYWAVATRLPADRGLGMTVQQADAELTRLRQLLLVLPDPPDLLDRWQRLAVAHDVKGKSAHDARLAACMEAHGLSDIVTFNLADFARYKGINAIDPRGLVRPAAAP